MVNKSSKLCYGDYGYEIIDEKIEITNYSGNATELIIPEQIEGKDVIFIGDSAFAGCSTLTSVTIPETVVSIGDCAFAKCFKLKTINIPDSVIYIGARTFPIKPNLSPNHPIYSIIEDILYEKNQKILKQCFSDKPTIIIPPGIKIIGSYSFSFCSTVRTMNIPDSVVSIEQGAFSSCESLSNINIPDSVVTIGKNAFSNCNYLFSIAIPDSVISIGEKAFFECSYMDNITISNSVTEIGLLSIPIKPKILQNHPIFSVYDDILFDEKKHIVKRCYSNKASIKIPRGMKTIEAFAFYDCVSLENLTIPSSVKEIGDNACENCESLSSVYIPESVERIGKNAFTRCKSLQSITIPKSVKEIGLDAFNRQTSIWVYPDSFARELCIDYGYRYVEIPNWL